MFLECRFFFFSTAAVVRVSARQSWVFFSLILLRSPLFQMCGRGRVQDVCVAVSDPLGPYIIKLSFARFMTDTAELDVAKFSSQICYIVL